MERVWIAGHDLSGVDGGSTCERAAVASIIGKCTTSESRRRAVGDSPLLGRACSGPRDFARRRPGATGVCLARTPLSAAQASGRSPADLTEALNGPMFESLKDPEVFRKLRVDEELRTIVWPNGTDLAPEYIFYQVFRSDPGLRATFRKRGDIADPALQTGCPTATPAATMLATVECHDGGER